ncbi:hypothetical protein Q3G72_028035 [Acer saccharum]|nr:hypothetical protein Q3G72_028035 [Acer saccharum]
MDLISSLKIGVTKLWIPPISNSSSLLRPPRSHAPYNFKFPNNNYLTVHAKKKTVLKPNLVQEFLMEEEDEEEELRFQHFEDDDGGEYFEDDSQVYVGDGGGGGGIALAGTWWDKEALAIAEDVCLFFDGDFKIYAFKTLPNSTIQVRIEKMSNKSGSPSIEDIDAFTASYRAKLEEAEIAKSIPENISVEVSSPGVERVVRIPQELDRFKDRAISMWKVLALNFILISVFCSSWKLRPAEWGSPVHSAASEAAYTGKYNPQDSEMAMM